ncbi:hypothetical protein [Arcobacter sp.]|uniref:hypothetical protein n=1 Tax=Arcobacter sp. TaxID=1872629 RepID=UPI003D0B6DE5
MIKIIFNSETNKFDIYRKSANNNDIKEILEESLNHTEINEKISEFSTQIYNMVNTLNELYLAVQKNPSNDIST